MRSDSAQVVSNVAQSRGQKLRTGKGAERTEPCADPRLGSSPCLVVPECGQAQGCCPLTPRHLVRGRVEGRVRLFGINNAGGLGLRGSIDRHISIRLPRTQVIQLQSCGGCGPDLGIKVEIVPKEDVVPGQRTVEFDIVVLCKVGKVKCRGIAGRGEVEVCRLLERAVKSGGRVVVCSRDSTSDGIDVNISATAREISVVCQNVESRTGRPT